MWSKPLVDLGITAKGIHSAGRSQPAVQRQGLRELDCFWSCKGSCGPISEKLKRSFSKQNPDVRFMDTIHHVAVKQTVAALTHDPRMPRFISNFRVTEDDISHRIEAKILEAMPMHADPLS